MKHISKSINPIPISCTAQTKDRNAQGFEGSDEVVLYSDVSESIKLFDFDVFAVGADQQHSGFQKAIEYCKANGKEVVRWERTQGISSTLIRKELLKD